MKGVILCLLTTITLIISDVSYCFWSVEPLNFHNRITEEGLKVIFYQVEGKKIKLSKTAIDRIAKYNTKVDKGFSEGEPSFHFDDEMLNDSYTLIVDRKERIIDILSSEEKFSKSSQSSTWETVGRNLHLIQDFYSHSTWVDLGHTDIVNFTSNSSLPYFTKSSKEIGDVCITDKPNKILTVNNITTGYYHKDPTEAGKCHHGAIITKVKDCRLDDTIAINALGFRIHPITGAIISTGISAGLIFEGKYGGKGINKDDAECNNISKLAKKLAIKETTTFIQSIIDELDKNNNIEGICALMGILKDECPEKTIEPNPEADDNIVIVGTEQHSTILENQRKRTSFDLELEWARGWKSDRNEYDYQIVKESTTLI